MIKNVLIVSILLLAGCFSTTSTGEYGRDFPIERSKSIIKNETTKEQVTFLCGRPFSTTVSDSVETWTYSYSKSKVSAGLGKASTTSDTKVLYIIFDASGRVSSFTVTQSGQD